MIIFVQETSIAGLPPVISLLKILKDLGERVVYYGFTQSDVAESILREIGVEYELYPYRVVLFRDHPFYRLWQKVTRRIRPYIFRRWVWKRIAAKIQEEKDFLLWSCEMKATAILGDKARSFGRRHVVSLYELGDEVGRNYKSFDIEQMYHTATLIECEYNRAHILKAEHSIPNLPFILPNKPYYHVRRKDQTIHDGHVSRIVQSWQGKRVFLYQGALKNDTGNLFKLIMMLCQTRYNDIVAVMGQYNNTIRECEEKYSNFCYVPYVAPPHHLEVTSHADVGIAYYEGGRIYGLSPLNPVYCAPNKIFEYTGFSIPILCNDIPGLVYTIGKYEAGICLDEFSEEKVLDAADKIVNDYGRYSANATKFFESVDVVEIVKKILAYARS